MKLFDHDGNVHLDKIAYPQVADRGRRPDCPSESSEPTPPSTDNRRCDRGAGRGDDLECPVKSRHPTAQDPPSRLKGRRPRPGKNRSFGQDGFYPDHKTHHPMKPRSLQSLICLLLLAAAAPLIDAQYTEMIAWISGSDTSNPDTGPGNSYPQGRRNFGSFYDPTLKLFHVFGGWSFGMGYVNDFWQYGLVSNAWTLLSSEASLAANNVGSYGTVGQEGSTLLPRARSTVGNTYDPQNRWYFVFGGVGLDAGWFGDLWRYELTGKKWTLLSGSSNSYSQYGSYPASTSLYGTENSYYPGGRQGTILAYDPQGQYLFVYGGTGYSSTTGASLDELWRFSLATRQWAFMSGTIDKSSSPVYGTLGIPSSSNSPGSRLYACSFFDPSRRSFYVAFGHGGIRRNDVWRYTIADSRWTWISGSNGLVAAELNAPFPALGEEASQPAPPARFMPSCYYNASTSIFFVFGGQGPSGILGDIWRFNLDSLNWAFIGGRNTSAASTPTFGSRGVEATTNSMGSHLGVALFQHDNRIYLNIGYTGSSSYSAIMSSRIICPATQYWSNFLCYNCTGTMLTQVIEGRSSCVTCPANITCANGTHSCNPGFNPVGSSCIACGAGTFKSVYGSQTCASCPLNSVACSSVGFTCNAGYYSNGASCVACAAGTFKGVTGNQACSSCPSGSFTSGSGNLACTSCPLNTATCSSTGFTCNVGYYANGASCVACAAGTFKDVIGNQACTSCPSGSFASGTGSQACTNCSAGSFASGSGNQACTSCPAGSFASGTGNQACTSCPSGSFSSGTGRQACTNCSAGSFASGYGNQACTSCPAGSFANGSGNQACTSCPSGSFTSGTGNHACTNCPSGSFAIGSGNQACTSCPAGSFASGTGNQACTSCPSGSFASGTGNQACATCPTGSYSDIPGSTICIVCPAGATCDTISFTCNAGYLKINSTHCATCPVNTFKEAAGNDATTCLNCPSNYGTCNSTTFFCNRGFERLGALCLACSSTPSTYKPLIGNEACSSCPAGATCNMTDFTCLEGYFRSGSGCSVCPANTYKSTKGNEPCSDCPVGASCLDSTSFVCQAGYKKTGHNCTVVTGPFYKPMDGNVDPIQCPAGASCNATEFTCVAGYYQSGSLCFPCDSNTFKSVGGNLASCLPCPEAATCTRTDFTCSAGYFRTSDGCSPCSAQTYMPISGSAVCEACPTGATCDSVAFTCDAGWYKNGTQCSPCQGGSFKPSPGNSDCSSCPSNAACDTQSFTCKAGFFAVGSACSSCTPGYYKSEPSNDLCLMCPVDSTCNRTTYQCNTGYYPLASGCSPCSNGFYKPSIGNKECLACPAHASCDRSSFTCFAGYYQDGQSCSPCTAGTYSDKVGAKFCSVCPNYATCDSTSFSCQTGFYKRESSCTICPQGTFKDEDGICSYCPSNSLCDSDTYYCKPGFTLLGKECAPCASDKYKGFTGNEACLDCSSGAVCNGTHFACGPGHQLLLRACTTCLATTFKSGIGNTSCLACPDGASCNTTAITACPSGYQPSELDCQLASNGKPAAAASILNPTFYGLLGGVGGLLCIIGVVIAIVVRRSRAHVKSASEAKQRAMRAETALTQMSMNQLLTGYTFTADRGGGLHGFTQGGATSTGFTQRGPLTGFTHGNGLTQSQTTLTMAGGFSGSATSLNLPRNPATSSTHYFGQQTGFGTVGSTFTPFGQTYVPKTPALYFPDFLEVVEDKDFSRVKKISEGAMGEVWLAHANQQALVQRGDSYDCVVKVAKQHAKVSWEVFQQEITISYYIREHPNIVKVVGFSRSPFAVLLNYYPVGSLHDLIHDCRVQGFSWGVSWCQSFAIDIASGLSHMHKLSVAHCDIKPGNVLLKTEKGSLMALLSDFGISRILDGQASAAVAGFQTHNLNGVSFNYASPETIMRFRRRGDAGVNQLPQVIKAGDVYAWAVVVCEMLTRVKPWSK